MKMAGENGVEVTARATVMTETVTSDEAASVGVDTEKMATEAKTRKQQR